jgi:hypothetical protein
MPVLHALLEVRFHVVSLTSTREKVLPTVAISSGMTAADLERLKKCVAAAPDAPFICLDVANGWVVL